MGFILGYFTFVGHIGLLYMTKPTAKIPQILPPKYRKSYRQNTANLTANYLEKIWQNPL